MGDVTAHGTGTGRGAGPDRGSGPGPGRGRGADSVEGVLDTVFRAESPRIVATAARIVRDLGIAEEIAQDALVTALEQWPRTGVPERPGAWLTTAARHRAVDLVRRRETYARKLTEVGRALTGEAYDPEPSGPGDIDDDVLRLVFTTCHPVLSAGARTALTLRLVGGLRTDEVARALLVPTATAAARITRAKRTLAGAGVEFEVPYGEERAARLGSVLEVVYLIFNEGYAATSGDDLLRPGLCEDALRLARVLAALVPGEDEAQGLAALLELQAARTAARTGPDGRPVLLADQDRRRWDRSLVRRGFAALERAGDPRDYGPYALQAAVAACHARAASYGETDWALIAALYGRLGAVAPFPVVELNRAVAVSRAEGPAAALPLVDALAAVPALARYHLLPSVRGDLLARLGRTAEARAEFERAASLTRNGSERALLLGRARETGAPPP
ncbi:RNA polymerase sigma factor [Streptomyces sp. NPDC001744]|uniref:RNA polymerase sigma factor n=1 Tax=Streptomyces sp. NPDC001744 TaxID=3364606 RepID=UPI0036AB4BDA